MFKEPLAPRMPTPNQEEEKWEDELSVSSLEFYD